MLPIEGEIHKRQLMYLYKILLLPDDDPVSQMLRNLISMSENGEENWWSHVRPLLPLYGLPEDFNVIKQLSKNTFKLMVNKGVEHTMLEQLKRDCSLLKKTKDLSYSKLAMQDYLKVLFPNQAKLILKSRCQTLDIKAHNTYKFQEYDTSCRKCGICEETLDHVVNCEKSEYIDVRTVFEMDCISDSDMMAVQLSRIAGRIKSFYDEVRESSG